MQFYGEQPDGYLMRLDDVDTFDWARRPGACWPCSELLSRRVRVKVDRNGLCDLQIDGRVDADCPAHELEAIVADFLPTSHRHLWPVWDCVALA